MDAVRVSLSKMILVLSCNAVMHNTAYDVGNKTRLNPTTSVCYTCCCKIMKKDFTENLIAGMLFNPK